MASKLGTIFVEMDIDKDRWVGAQRRLLKEATSTSLRIEDNFKRLGIKSSAEMDLMRKRITNSFNMIKNSSKATANDIVRAEKAKTQQLKALHDQQYGHQTSLMTKLKKHWLGVSVAIYASMRVIRAGWDLIKEAADFEQQKRAFDNLTASYGRNGDKIIAGLKKVSDNTISTMELINKAGTAMMMGIAPDKVIRLMEIARSTARMTGQSVTDAFADISKGTARSSKLLLDNLGILVGVGKANEQWAAANNRTVESMTEVERKGAFLNAVIEAGSGLMLKLGEQADTTRDKMDRLTTSWANFKIEIGLATLALVGFIEKATDKTLDRLFGPITGDPKELAKQYLERQLGLALRSYNLMIQQGNVDQEALRLAESRIFTLRQRIALLEESPDKKGPLKLTIGSPGTATSLSNEPDMWAKGWAEAETAVQQTWQQSVYGFNQMQQQILSDQQTFADMKKAINDISLNDRVEAEQTALKKIREMNEQQAAREKSLRMQVLSAYQQAAGGIANTFMQIAQAGGKQSKKAFVMYKAFAIVEAMIGTALAITKAIGQLGAWGIPVAIALGAMGAVQIAMIAAAQPPSYDQGGVSQAKGVYQTGNISEAHIPLKSGKVPVKVEGGGGGPSVTIQMNNPVFQDVDTQRQVFAQIAEQIARKVAPNAVVQAYNNDHPIRGMIRSST